MVIFIVIVLTLVVTTVVAGQKDKTLVCDNNGKFTILIVSDPQCDTVAQWYEAKNELEILVKRAKPDFVLINGDMNSENNIPVDMWDIFISPLTQRNIYWATTNGNHDPFENEYYKMYKSYEYCLNSTVNTTDKNYESSRPMNYVLPIYSSDRKNIVFAIYGMDSGTIDKDGYMGLTTKQINWYKAQSDNLKQLNNGKSVTSILCMHIPLPQTKEMYYSSEKIYGVANEIKFSTKGYTTSKGQRIEKTNIHTSAVKRDNKMLDAILEQGDIKAVIFGHNHRNNFIGSYKGVLLGFAGKISTGCYSDNICRGGRVISFNESNPKKFTTEWLGVTPDAVDQPPIYSNGLIAK